MGLFKKLKKAFKKVVKGVKKGIKKVVKGVKKVVKKIGSSKILKALAIAAAVVVTGGAAIGAFTGGAGLAGTGTFAQFGNWMMAKSQLVTGGTLFGSAAGKTGVSKLLTQTGNFLAKTAAKPFSAVGSALGSAAGTLTDFTGLTTEASRMGVTPEIQQAMADAQIKAGMAGGPTMTSAATPTTLLSQEQAALEAAKAAGASPETMAYLQQKSAQTALSYGVPSADIVSAGLPEAKAMDTWAARNPKTAAFLTNVGTGVATSVATGYAMQQLAGDPELQGSMAGLRTEGATDFDPLRIYAAERGIADADISKYFTFSNTPEGGNMPLFSQETIGVA